MKQITKIIETETGHRLTGYQKRCAHLHGHRYRWEVTVTASVLDDIGFIMDYGDLKGILEDTIDQLDHAFIFHDRDPLVLYCDDNHVHSILDASNGHKGRIFIVPFNPTTENLVEWVASLIKPEMPSGIRLTHIRVWETSGSYCDWDESV